MHELAVTEGLLEIAVRHAAAHQAQRVTDLHIVIGQLASIVDDSVQFYWDIISAGTPCEGAHLTFERIPATLACAGCNLTFAFDPNSLVCPACGSANAKLITGEEFRLDSIEIEKAEPQPLSP